MRHKDQQKCHKMWAIWRIAASRSGRGIVEIAVFLGLSLVIGVPYCLMRIFCIRFDFYRILKVRGQTDKQELGLAGY